MSGLTLKNQQMHVMQRTMALPICEVENNPQSSCPHFNAFMMQVCLYALASYTCYGVPVLFAACTIRTYIFAYTHYATAVLAAAYAVVRTSTNVLC